MDKTLKPTRMRYVMVIRSHHNITVAGDKERKEVVGMDAICDIITSQRGKTRVEGLRECKEDEGRGEEGRKRRLAPSYLSTQGNHKT